MIYTHVELFIEKTGEKKGRVPRTKEKGNYN
jgi:hypothetical protein